MTQPRTTPVFAMLLALTAVVLVVLPFVSTFDDLLTVIGMKLGIAARRASSGAPVVMVESSEHRDCVNASLGLRGAWNGLLVRESLVRACVVVETHLLGDDASKMFLAEDEDVIEQLSAEGARQALSEGIHVRRAYRGAHDAHARRREYASKASAELRVVVADKHIWRTVHGGVPGLLRAPFVGRRIRDRGVDDLSAAEVEEKEHENFAEPDVVRLDEVARPRDVVAQERRPALAVAWGPGAADVPLDGPLADADAELEQLAADALGAPARIARRHLADQCRARGGRPSRWPRAPPPEGAESGPMPAEDSRRLDEQGCLTPSWRDACGESNGESLPRCPPDAARDFPLRHDELLSKKRVLRDELAVTTNEIGGESRNEPKEIDHVSRLTPSAHGWHL